MTDDGKQSSYQRVTEKSQVSDDGLKSRLITESVSTTSSIRTTTVPASDANVSFQTRKMKLQLYKQIQEYRVTFFRPHLDNQIREQN